MEQLAHPRLEREVAGQSERVRKAKEHDKSSRVGAKEETVGAEGD
jgi:hypothetical protein